MKNMVIHDRRYQRKIACLKKGLSVNSETLIEIDLKLSYRDM